VGVSPQTTRHFFFKDGCTPHPVPEKNSGLLTGVLKSAASIPKKVSLSEERRTFGSIEISS
jgi:hypothetical protein